MKRKTKTILLVEDQIISAAPAIKVLKNAGYDVVYVMNGENAVAIVEAGLPLDLIVMDVELGFGICGMTASEKINLIREIPIIFFTSFPEEYIKERIGNSSYFNYLSKKNNYASLVESVDRKFHFV